MQDKVGCVINNVRTIHQNVESSSQKMVPASA